MNLNNDRFNVVVAAVVAAVTAAGTSSSSAMPPSDWAAARYRPIRRALSV